MDLQVWVSCLRNAHHESQSDSSNDEQGDGFHEKCRIALLPSLRGFAKSRSNPLESNIYKNAESARDSVDSAESTKKSSDSIESNDFKNIMDCHEFKKLNSRNDEREVGLPRG